MGTRYYSFNEYLREKFGTRVHRISLNAGFSCPNRDGTLDTEGCIFCNEKSFSHFPGSSLTLEEQIASSMNVLRKRFKAEKFIAYFQDASNTYAAPRELKKAYDTIKVFPDIVGLFISTRPDSVDGDKLDLIESYTARYDVWMEYGLQSVHDASLKSINRHHTFSQTLEAVEATSERNIKIAVHVILGIPGESRDNIIKTAKTISKLPISGVKLHVLHVLRDTKLEGLFNEGKIKLLSADEYIKLACDFLECLNPKCVILRLVSDAKDNILVQPKWINEKAKVIEGIKDEFRRKKTRQGSKHEGKKSLCIR